MEKDIVEGPIGSVGSYDVEFKGGALVAKVQAGIDQPLASGLVELKASVSGEVKIPAGKVIDAIAAKIPGQIDDAVLNLIKAALLG